MTLQLNQALLRGSLLAGICNCLLSPSYGMNPDEDIRTPLPSIEQKLKKEIEEKTSAYDLLPKNVNIDDVKKLRRKQTIGGNPDLNAVRNTLYHTENEKEDFRYFRALADLGIKDTEGIGVEKNMKVALRIFQLAAQQGDTIVLYNLGVMYEDGIGVKKDEMKASIYYTLAAHQGDEEAQYFLACMYKDGRGVRKDKKKASYYFQHAADQGHLCAQDSLLKLKYTTLCELANQITESLRYRPGYGNLKNRDFAKIRQLLKIRQFQDPQNRESDEPLGTQARLFLAAWGEIEGLSERYNILNPLPQQSPQN